MIGDAVGHLVDPLRATGNLLGIVADESDHAAQLLDALGLLAGLSCQGLSLMQGLGGLGREGAA